MARVIFNGEPGAVFTNDTGKVLFQFVCQFANSCGVCISYARAIGPSWPIPLHRGCLLPGTEIIPSGIEAAFEARYAGPVHRITFDDGVTVAVTANHMLLTTGGFATASSLVNGDDVIYCPGAQGEFLVDPHDDRQPARIEDVIKSLAVSLGVAPVGVPVAPEDLHGDGRFCQGKVNVIAADGFLRGDADPAGFEHVAQFGFERARLSPQPLPGAGDQASVLFALRDATDGGVGGVREGKAFFRAQLRHAVVHGGATVPNGHLVFAQDLAYKPAGPADLAGYRLFAHAAQVHRHGFGFDDFADPEAEATGGPYRPERDALFAERSQYDIFGDAVRLRDVIRRFPGEVAVRRVRNVNSSHYCGPVYDVQTTSSLYLFGNGVASSNCRCQQRVVLPGKDALPFVDFLAEIRALPPAQQAVAVGRANWQLLSKGVVDFSEVVTPQRVRTLREVVSRNHLDVGTLLKAGVNRRTAERAYQAVHTPAHELAAAHRQVLVDALAAKGLTKDQLQTGFGQRLASRVGIAGGPGARPQPDAPAVPPGGLDYRSLGVEFVRNPADVRNRRPVVIIDVAKLDAAWAEDEKFSIPAGGGGAEVGGRRAGFAGFLEKARAEGVPVEMPTVHVGKDGSVSFLDGRHRFSVLRDMGVTTLPVAVGGSPAAARKLFGAAEPAGAGASAPGRADVTAAVLRSLGVKPAPAAPPPAPPPSRRFDSPGAMDRWGESAYRDWAAGLSPAEGAALREYTASAFDRFNKALRAGKSDQWLGPTDRSDVADLTAALSRARLPEPITVYRGVRKLDKLGLKAADLVPGLVLPADRGFGSTSLDADRAAVFAGGGLRGGVLFRIDLPAGAPGAYVNAAGEFSGKKAEKEFLMPPGALKLRVKSVVRSPTGRHVIHAELVP